MDKDLLLRKRKNIYDRNSYVPWQPGFEIFGNDYENTIIDTKHHLNGVVADFYEISKADFSTYSLPTIPDGCTDLIFAYVDGEIHGYISTGVKQLQNFYFGKIDALFGVRFMPGSTYHIFRDSIQELVHNPVDISYAVPHHKQLIEGLQECNSFQQKMEKTTRFVEEHLLLKDTKAEILNFCMHMIYEKKGNVRIDELSAMTGYSSRYLQKLFDNFVGLSPKEFCKAIRLQYTMNLLHQYSNATMKNIALFAGYTDTSHMNREFHKYIGKSANEARKQSLFTRSEKKSDIVFL